MTCIAGIVDAGRVVIGGDSAGVAGYHLDLRADEKVFRNGPYAIGFTTSFRMGQILRYAQLPEPQDWDVDRFMATTFVDAIRKAMRDGGYAVKSNNRETGGTFLVGWKDRLYSVHDDFQVGRSLREFTACGCGYEIALGALQASMMLIKWSAEQRLRLALETAESWSAGVRGPFNFVST